MDLLTPLGLWLALLAVPILLLYMLKLRRVQVLVSSIMLWTQLLRDRQANTPWQKLRRNLLLVLQLLLLAALVLALARPAVQTPVVATGSLVVLLDASASMQATDVSPTRFEEARRATASLIDGLSGGSRMTLILVGATPQALASSETNKALLGSALAGAEPTQGTADWGAAFALAAGAAQGDRDVTTVIVSDGGLPENGLPSLPGEVRYVSIGIGEDNLALTAMALRTTVGGVPALFVEATNFGSSEHRALLSLYFGQSLLTSRLLELPPGARQSLSLQDLPDSPGVYRARLSAPPGDGSLDDFPLDDSAYAVYQPSAQRRVLLVSSGNLFLEQLLTSLPGIRPFRALPVEDGTLQLPEESFGLYIFDGALPPELPDGNLLLVNPSSNALFEVGATTGELGAVTVTEHALTRYVDWGRVHILQARQVLLPAWGEVLIGTESLPLVFAGETEGRRVAVLTFDLRESDLPLQVAYPILFTNLINYLLPPSAFDATQALAPGESLTIVVPPGVERVAIASPSDRVTMLVPGAGALTFRDTLELGYYAVNYLSTEVSSVEYFAVNLFEASESDIHPRESLQVGRAAIAAAEEEKVSQRELWPWLAGLAILLLVVEWQAYHRRLSLPRRVSNTPLPCRSGGGR